MDEVGQPRRSGGRHCRQRGYHLRDEGDRGQDGGADEDAAPADDAAEEAAERCGHDAGHGAAAEDDGQRPGEVLRGDQAQRQRRRQAPEATHGQAQDEPRRGQKGYVGATLTARLDSTCAADSTRSTQRRSSERIVGAMKMLVMMATMADAETDWPAIPSVTPRPAAIGVSRLIGSISAVDRDATPSDSAHTAPQ